ncbi:uncharacterized protein N7477_003950 [Penicillium maclennaniae]|uniref:uncharacterized protein n=1 Tax=Penicillium maclennaniae TaxID=1343394 RepID=UPI0025413E59|nr:uncharacterized protein N7477_003950 [Penicillium maclennaniae]KAJ5678317.1 hypothetical protein N7477_003950 [Penicillium maclennaniae]
MPQSPGIKTRICMISDTHTFSPSPPQQTNNPYRNPLPKADVLLHAGDLTKVGYLIEHEETVAMLKAAPAELKLVIAGNHDLTLDEEHFTSFGYFRHRRPERLGGQDTYLEEDEKPKTLLQSIRSPNTPLLDDMKSYCKLAKDLYTDESAYAAGIRYLEEGTHSFTLSTGAKLTIYASPYQPEFCNWAFGYNRSEDRFNPPLPGNDTPAPQNPVPSFPAVDIMLTHGPPANVLDFVPPDSHVGCEHLFRAAERARPRVYLFGHIHEGWGAIRGVWNEDAENGIKQEVVRSDMEDMLERRGAYYDVSGESGRPLRVGEETLFVNASICTVKYEPRNAPWVVDLDLPGL